VPTSRVARDFNARPYTDQKWLLENTWCSACGAADLGMRDPSEYEEDGAIYVEGCCLRCGSAVRSSIEVVERNSQELPPNNSLERTRER
jgi:hypothetical protein